MRRIRGAGVAVVLVTAGAVVLLPAVPAAAASACGDDSGVTVAVDFSTFGGGVDLRCAGGNPGSALAALRSAGFSWSSTLLSTSLSATPVCRIDDLPSLDEEACLGAADAGWTHWYAARGGSWSRTDTSPGSWDPAPGSVEGWAFGAGPPGVAPPLPIAPPAEPLTVEAPPTVPAHSPPSAGGGAAVSGSRTGLGDATGRSTGPGMPAIPEDGTAAGPTPTASPSRPASPTTTPSGPAIGAGLPPGFTGQPEAAPRPVSHTDEALRVFTGGSPAGMIGAGLLLASLAAAGVLLAGRRRAGRPWVWSLDRAD